MQRMHDLAAGAANTVTTDGVAQQAEVTELLAEADRLQRLIANYMDHVQADIDASSHVRRATTAYARVEASI